MPTSDPNPGPEHPLRGRHVCCVFETEAERSATLRRFSEEALTRRERVLLIVADDARAATLRALEQADPSVAEATDGGGVTVLAVSELPDGTASAPERLAEFLRRQAREAVAGGSAALAAVVDVAAVCGGSGGADLGLWHVESARLCAELPCTLLSAYGRKRFGAEDLLSALRSHPLVLVGPETQTNPYFIPRTDVAASGEAEATLRAWLNTLAQAPAASGIEDARLFAEILDCSAASIIIHGTDGEILYANRRAAELHNIPHEEFLALRIADINTPQTRALVPERMERLLADGEAAFEACHPRRGGEPFPVHVQSRVARWGDRQVIIGVHTDITERKQTEEALRRALAETQRAHGDIAALLVATRAVLQAGDFATTARRIFDQCRLVTGATSGYVALLREDGSENDVLFLEAGDLPCTVDPDLPMPIRGLRAVAYETRRPAYDNDFHQSGWMAYMPAGHVRLDNVLFAPLLIDGKAVGLLGLANKPGGFTEDDADLAEAFGELASVALLNSRVLDLLRDSEDRYRGLFEQMLNGFAYHRLVTDDAGRPVDYVFLEVNGAFERMTGLRREDVIGRSAKEVFGKTDARWFAKYSEVALSGGEARFETYSAELGRWFSVLAYSPRPGHFATVLEDLTDRHRAEEAQRLASVGQLAAGVAHEFNNLLAGLLMQSERAGQKRTPEQYQKLAEMVQRSALRGGELCRNLTSFARPSTVRSEPVSMDKPIDRALEMAAREIENAGVTVVRSLSPEGATVMADCGQMEQVLLNLLINACHAMPAGGTLAISTSRQTDPKLGAVVRTQVRDTGTGMSPDQASRVFEPFFTTKGRLGESDTPGTGLGLSVSHGIVAAHGGAISVESQVGLGTVFTIDLPACDGPASDGAGEPRSPTEAATSAARLLIAEDEDDLREVLCQALLEAGHDAVAVPSVGEAVDQLANSRFDLVIADMLMPGGGGREILRVLSTMPTAPAALVVTGKTEPHLDQELLALGATGCLRKPFSVDEVLRAVGEALQGRRTP